MKIPANLQVNRLGKYLYRHIDSAYKFKTSSNTCDVYMTVYYQVPYLPDRPGGKKTYSDVMEMKLDISITTYQNKIRVNILEISPEETTIGFDLYHPDLVQDLPSLTEVVLDKIEKRVSNRYKDYEFMF